MANFHHTNIGEDKVESFKRLLYDVIAACPTLSFEEVYDGSEYRPVLVDKIRDQLTEITSFCGESVKNTLGLSSNLQLKSVWAVYGKKNSSCPIHKHTEPSGGHYASTLYLESQALTALYYIENDKRKYYYPKQGDLVVLPFDMYHGTTAQKEESRITFNMDWVKVD